WPPGRPRARSRESPLADEVDEVTAQARAELRVIETELDVRLQEAELLPDVVAAGREDPTEDGFGLEEQRDRVGELVLAADARLDALERVEDGRCEDVPPDHGQVRRRLVRLRLLDDGAHAAERIVHDVGLGTTERRDLLRRHFEQ